jgi:uncharacterized protein (TIGR00297 family)
MSHVELPRQLVHIGVGAIALSFAWLSWTQAVVLAGSAVVFNVWILPRVTARVFRPGDLDAPWTSGIVLYPLAVLGLVLVFRERLDLAAAGWIILAAGDGVATLVGTHLRSPRLPWNPNKSLAGLMAFLVAASATAAGAVLWMGSDAATLWWVVAAAIAAGFVETIPIRMDDNVTVSLTAACVLWSSTLVDPQILSDRIPAVAAGAVVAVGVNGVVAVAGLLARTVTPAGATTGLVIGTIVMLGGGWAAWGLLIATFVTASLCTRVGAAQKAVAGIAEDRGGRRGPGNAIANTGLAGWCCALAVGMNDPSPALLAVVAALATAGSDTVASEIGKAYGRTTWQVTSGRRVPPGTTGAVSLEGTAAGVASATALAALGAWWGLVPWTTVPLIMGASTVASLIEGALGATWEARGILNNDTLNFVNAAMGAAITVAAWMWWTP